MRIYIYIYIYIYILLSVKTRLMRCIIQHFIHTVKMVHVSNLKGRYLGGSTDTFHESGQQNTCPDVNMRLKSSVNS